MTKHIGIYLTNKSDKKELINRLFRVGFYPSITALNAKETGVFSSLTIVSLIEEEYKHDRVMVCTNENRSLSTMSSGQQKKALLNYLMGLNQHTLLLDDVYGNVDLETQQYMDNNLPLIAKNRRVIQIFFRKQDLLSFIDTVLILNNQNELLHELNAVDFKLFNEQTPVKNQLSLPEIPYLKNKAIDPLIELKNINVNYEDKEVLRDVNWTIRSGEFWQLAGPNGSGKSTILGMICGDNAKAYGQQMTLFGRKKGSGETIWDIKKQIGYFTPNMTLQFTRYDSIENMIISGLNDSIGLYVEPTDLQKNIAKQWVKTLGLENTNKNFQQLSAGEQRMVMVARAMVKHPALLILDEPTIELDDNNSELFINMVQAIAKNSNIAIVYVSHRYEKNLQPHKIFELVKYGKAYTGIVR